MTYSKSVRCALAFGAFLWAAGPRAASAASDDLVLYARDASVVAGAWSRVSDSTAAGGVRLANPDAGAAKLGTPLASPTNYFEVTFTPQAGRAYHLWIRAKAQNDSWTNDSVYVQFSGSSTAAGAAYRIGTTSAIMYSLEEYSGAGESGWGWQDGGYGVGVHTDPLYFDGSTQRIRIQSREDGISIDQIVLSPVTYAAAAPGAAKNDATILPPNNGTTTAPPPPTGTTAVVWTNAVNAAASGSTLQKTAGCSSCFDAGAVSQQQITSGTASFSVVPGQLLFVGLGRDASSSTAYTIDYAFEFTSLGWEIREGNIYRTEGSFTASDVFGVSVSGTTVTYKRNGTTVYTSKVPVSGPLVVDASIATVGGSVVSASISGDTTLPPPPQPPIPPPPPPPSGPVVFKVLQWNIHHGGYGTDNVYSPERIVNWVQAINPDVVMFNEIEKNDSWGNQDQPEVYKALLEQKMVGATWYYVFAQEFGQWNANGKGNLILSRYPISIVDRYELTQNYDRSVAMATITVNSRDITLILTHLDPYDATLRLAQAKEVTGWAAPQPENRILTGDMNAWPDQSSIAQLTSLYNDSWVVATAAGTATAFTGNSGETKSGRIDYIFYSKNAGNLTVKSSQVYDTRDANGIMPSDHRPVATTFEVR